MLPVSCKDCIAEPEVCKCCRFYGQPNIRDFFAGCALIGLTIRWKDAKYKCDEAAKIVFDFADELIKAREA